MENIYKDWEQNIIKTFYKKDKSKSIKLPINNYPLYAYKEKIMLVINFIDDDGIDILTKTRNNYDNIPERQHLELYHIGEKSLSSVSFGLKDNEVSFPGIDVGGLTTYRQNKGENIMPFQSIKYKLDEKVSSETINSIYKTWKKYAGKNRFYGNIKEELTKAIRSIKKKCFIQFYKVPKEFRVICTSFDIYNKTGNYYNRIFGSKDYAKITKPRKDLYCSITNKYITPNINKNNILNEYKIC